MIKARKKGMTWPRMWQAQAQLHWKRLKKLLWYHLLESIYVCEVVENIESMHAPRSENKITKTVYHLEANES